MDLLGKATIMHYHRHRLAVHGDGTVGALGWRGVESQFRRFEVLATVGDLDGRAVLDVGCGYGDLKGFLDERFRGFTYVGIDQMPEFVAEARRRYGGCPNTFFYQTDFTTVSLPQVDYVMASGALGYRSEQPGFYADMIRKLYNAATHAAAFNMLDAACFPAHPLLTGHDPEAIVAFCRTLSPHVRVVRGYLPDDFTVVVSRPAGPQP